LLATTKAFESAAELAETDVQRASAWFELATFMERMHQPKPASTCLEKLVGLDPPTTWHAPALDRLARVYQRLGKLDEAAQTYARLAQLPDVSPRMVEIAIWGQARMYQQLGRMDKAVEAARKLLDEHPDSAYAGAATATLVEGHVQKGELAEARRLADVEARREGGNAGLLMRVAADMKAAGLFEEALEALDTYTRLRSGDQGAYQLFYDIHSARGTLAEYQESLGNLADDAQRREEALRRLADLYSRQREPGKALATLERLIDLIPTDANLISSTARTAMHAGKREKAVELYERALALSPDSTPLRSELGDVYAEIGDKEKALETWKRAYRYSPENAMSVQMLGRHLHAHGYYQDAVNTYLEAREALGDPAAFAEELGEEYETLLWVDKAVVEYVTALSVATRMNMRAGRRLQMMAADEMLGPDVIRILEARRAKGDMPDGAVVALGLAHLKAGQPDKATEVFRALEGSEGQAMSLIQTASMLESRGDNSVALGLYEAAMRAALPAVVQGQVALRLAALHSGNGDWRRARDVLSVVDLEAVTANLASNVRLALGDVLILKAGDHESALPLYVHVLVNGDDEQSLHAGWGLADCAFVAEEYAAAAKAYRELMAEEPGRDAPPPPPFGGGMEPFMFTVPGPGFFEPERPMGVAYGAYQLAEIEFRSERFGRARKQFEQLAKEHPNSRYANDALERALLIATEFTGESPAEPKYVEALRLVDRGKLEEAVRILKMIHSLGPDEPLADDSALLHAAALSRFGDLDEAAEAYEAIPRRFPDSPLAAGALVQAARIVAREPAGREQALAILRGVMVDFPESPESAEAELVIDGLKRR